MANGRASKWGLRRAWPVWSLVLVIPILVASQVVIRLVNDPRYTLGILALTAGAMAWVGATLRVIAHDRKDLSPLDGIGKMFSFGAAFLAMAAGFLVLANQIQHPDLPL